MLQVTSALGLIAKPFVPAKAKAVKRMVDGEAIG